MISFSCYTIVLFTIITIQIYTIRTCQFNIWLRNTHYDSVNKPLQLSNHTGVGFFSVSSVRLLVFKTMRNNFQWNCLCVNVNNKQWKLISNKNQISIDVVIFFSHLAVWFDFVDLSCVLFCWYRLNTVIAVLFAIVGQLIAS